MALAGLDVGTSGVKCAVFTPEGQRIGFAKREYDCFAAGGHYELDAAMVWHSAKEVLKSAAAQAREPVAGLAISCLGEAGIPLDKGDRPLDRAILFNDLRGRAESERLCEAVGRRRLYDIAGVVPNGTYTVEKLMWLRQHSAYYPRIKHFPLFEDFLVHRLTGERVISHSLAARTMAFDVVAKSWSRDILQAAELPVALFSTPQPSGRVAGQIRPALAAELGLPKELRVVSGGHDGWCCALGAGLLDNTLGVNVCGTCETMSFLLDGPRREDYQYRGSYSCSPYVLDGRYGTTALNLTSGSLLKWLRGLLGADALPSNAGQSFYQTMDARVAPGPSGILAVPSFSVSGTPDFSLDATGLLEGLTLTTGAADLYRGLMEGTVYHLRLNLELLARHGIRARRFRAVGGAAASPVWMQIKADILDAELETVQGGEAGVIGCALLAGLALGVYRDEREAARALIHPDRRYAPNPAHRSAYDALFQRYQSLYRMTHELEKYSK